MKRKNILVMMATLPLLTQAQTLSLDQCQKMAHDNYPAIRQYGLTETLRDYTVSNAAKAWLPQVRVQAGGYAYTDIAKSDGQAARIGIDMRNHMASGSISVTQNLYDGGQTAAAKQTARAQADVLSRQTDVSMHDIRERVEQIYFGVLTIDEQLSQNSILLQDLAVSSATIESLRNNGLANQSDLDAVSVEQLKACQQADALKNSRKAYLRMLGILIGKPLDETAQIERPTQAQPVPSNSWGARRPELAYYTAQDKLLDTQRRQLDARLRPTVSLMGLGALHTQVSDLVHNGFLLGGITLSWNIGALYTRKNDIGRLVTQRQQNDNLRETFIFNNRLQNEETNGQIQALHSQLTKDRQIVALRENIRQANEKKVKLGTETVNELVRSIHAVSMARQQQSLHELQLLQAIYHSQTINNE